MKKKITIIDKILSFRQSTIEQYVENELWLFAKNVDYETDFIKRHWMFFFLNSFHVFVFLWFFVWLLYFITKYHVTVTENFLQWNLWVDIVTWTWSFLTILFFIFYIVKAEIINKIWILIWFIISVINIFLQFNWEISISYTLEMLYSTAWILLFIFLIEVILKSIKVIYDVLIDYRNDFIIIYPEWLYISEKTWALNHEYQRILFDEVVDVSSVENWILWNMFWYWKLNISIMWTWSNYTFEFCNDIVRAPTRLNDKRIEYYSLKKMKAKKENEFHIKPQEKCKPFKSRIRDDLIKIMNLKK